MNDWEPVEPVILTPEQSEELTRQGEREFRDAIAARYGVDMARKAENPREMLRLARTVALELATDAEAPRRKRRFASEFLVMSDEEAEIDVQVMLLGADDRLREPRLDWLEEPAEAMVPARRALPAPPELKVWASRKASRSGGGGRRRRGPGRMPCGS